MRPAVRICAALVACVLVSAIGTSAPAPARGGSNSDTLTIALVGSPNTLDPIVHTQAIEAFLGSLVFDGLVRATPDGNITPILARRVPSLANGGISRDGLRLTYALRRGIRWHDGAPFTSRDVAFTQAAMTDPRNDGGGFPYSLVSAIETPDDDTVVVHLKKPSAPFIAEWFAGIGSGILPMHLLGAYSELNDVPFNAAPVGTGPFVFDRWDRGRDIVFHANDGYFLGRPKLRRIVVELVADEASRNVALQAGEVDWNWLADAASARQFAGRRDLRLAQVSVNAYCGLILQTRRPPLDDTRVRRAIAYALDRATMVSKISGPFATRATSNIGPGDWAFDSSIAPIPFDLGRSRALLASAGWRPSSSGMLERAGKPLELTLFYQAGSHSYAAYALEIQAMLRTIGIDIDLKPTALSVLAAPEGTQRSGNFDLLLLTFYGGSDPSDLNNFTCGAIPPNGNNESRWCDREYDRVTSAALSRTDRERRRRDYRRASQILIEQVPEIFIYEPKLLDLTRRPVHIDDAPDDVWAPNLWSKE